MKKTRFRTGGWLAWLPALIFLPYSDGSDEIMRGAVARKLPSSFAVTASQEENSMDSLEELLLRSQELEKRHEKLAETVAEDRKDNIKEELEIIAFIKQWLLQVLDKPTSHYVRTITSVQTDRILRAIESTAGLEGVPKMISQLGNLTRTKLLGHSLPFLNQDQRSSPLGLDAAKDESRFLYNPEADDFFSPAQLTGLSPEKVSELDVSMSHPAWLRGHPPADSVASFEKWMTEGMNTALLEEGDIPEMGAWDLIKTRKVLFMEEIYKSTTSAKGVAEDGYGVEWKFKWGDEVHTEAIACRLYLMAGGKMTDLVYVGGQDDMILVLNAPGEYEEGPVVEGAERDPETVEQMQDTLMDFYGFDLQPYILERGVLTENNIHELLKHLPPDVDNDYKMDNLIGRQWVRFREYSLELKPQAFMIRFDSCRLSDWAASNDRAARGLHLFSLWVSNRDIKDSNAKGYFIRTLGAQGKLRITEYLEGIHDHGLTFGTLFAGGEINEMTTGENFLHLSADGQSIVSDQVYDGYPDSWNHNTWADDKWMARRITRISEEQIREAVASSRWPDFFQEALVYKILNRQKVIARLYDLPIAEKGAANPPNISIALGSRDEIATAEQKYNLRRGSLEEELKNRQTGPAYRETLIRNGQVASSAGSALIHLLVRQHHPSGLPVRYKRASNEHPPAIASDE